MDRMTMISVALALSMLASATVVKACTSDSDCSFHTCCDLSSGICGSDACNSCSDLAVGGGYENGSCASTWNDTFCYGLHNGTEIGDTFGWGHDCASEQRCCAFPTKYVAVTTSTVSPSEPCGQDWLEATNNATWTPRFLFESDVHSGDLWIMGGGDDIGNFYNDVWSSPDGASWTQATANAGWDARLGGSVVEKDGKMWMIGGMNSTYSLLNDVWSSTDGANWTEVTGSAGWSPRWLHSTVVYGGKIWVFGGYDGTNVLNDVWYSSDGANWTEATPNASWNPRWQMRSVVYGSKMWIIAGQDIVGGIFNDVWHSTDGTNWTEATNDTGYEPRTFFGAQVFNGRIWVIGGTNSTYDDKSDVWSSTDGATWSEATPAGPWFPRVDFATANFNGHMWVLGGVSDQTGVSSNDVWYSECIEATTTTTTTVAPYGACCQDIMPYLAKSCVDNATLLYSGTFQNQSYTLYTECPFGCDMQQQKCSDPPYVNNLWVLAGVIVFIVAVLLLFRLFRVV